MDGSPFLISLSAEAAWVLHREMKNDWPPDAATLRSRAQAGWVLTGGPSVSFLLVPVVFVNTSIRGGKVSVCLCVWQGGRMEEAPPAKRKESHAASWRSCQDSAARAATAGASPRSGCERK